MSATTSKRQACTDTSGYCDPEGDDLFAQAAVEQDEARRKALCKEVQDILLRDMPMIWADDLGR